MKFCRNAIWLVGILWLSACTDSFRVKESPDTKHRVFPDGTYRHDVVLSLPNGQRHQFQGVVKLGPERIEVAGLSFFGTTVFRVVDDKNSREPEVKIFVPQLQAQEGKVREMYSMLKKLLLMPPEQAQKTTLPGGALLRLANYDEHHIPRTMRIANDKFAVDVKVIGYDI